MLIFKLLDISIVWKTCKFGNVALATTLWFSVFFNFYSEILWIIGIRRVLLSKITEDVIVVVTLECGCHGNGVMVVLGISNIVFVYSSSL